MTIEQLTPYLVNVAALVISVCAPVAAVGLYRWAMAHKQLLEAQTAATLHLTPSQLDTYLTTLVHAAEQLYQTNQGEQKKKWVLGLAQTWLATRGIVVNLTELDAQVEAKVYTELNQEREKTTTTTVTPGAVTTTETTPVAKAP